MNAETETLQARWTRVQQQVADACRSAGRDPDEVGILPVSKTFGPELIREAVGLGLHRFGENKIQEIRDKSEPLADCGIDWVVLGNLQTNKINAVTELAREVQTLDRPKLAAALDQRLRRDARVIDVLIQVKTAEEPSKHGLAPKQLLPFLDELRDYPTLRVRGLMTMAVHTKDPDTVRGCFRLLRQLRDRAAGAGHDLPELSMGMSGDFPLAIAEGATEVRIGTAIFGSRTYPDPGHAGR